MLRHDASSSNNEHCHKNVKAIISSLPYQEGYKNEDSIIYSCSVVLTT